ncbi:hypothetical protein [Liquorilactobacillus nagelii]|uniref:hypothetical protein n=1 Tax=Liquorilactobacillus nagelii TaxID=82688 RepID=UPI0039EC4310
MLRSKNTDVVAIDELKSKVVVLGCKYLVHLAAYGLQKTLVINTSELFVGNRVFKQIVIVALLETLLISF